MIYIPVTPTSFSVHDKFNSDECNSTKTGVILEKGFLGNIFPNFHIDRLGKKSTDVHL